MRPCPSCTNPVSEQAVACPKCGHPFKTSGSRIDGSDPVHLIGVVLAVIILLAFLAAGVRGCNAY